MGPAEALAILGAGVAAGAVNAVVGSGSLITFPTLLAFGFPPVVANVSNNVGLVSGNISGAVGYRRELAGQRGRLIRLGIIAAAGRWPARACCCRCRLASFSSSCPRLILIACVLVIIQPWMSAWLAKRRLGRQSVSPSAASAASSARHERASARTRQPRRPERDGGPVLGGGVFASGAYGGYFGAAQGVLVIGLLGTFLDESMQRVNGAKNVLVAVVNGTAAIVYIIFAHVAWLAVLLIAVGSTIGGLLGARFGRRLPPLALRIFVVVIGVISAVKLIFF